MIRLGYRRCKVYIVKDRLTRRGSRRLGTQLVAFVAVQGRDDGDTGEGKSGRV